MANVVDKANLTGARVPFSRGNADATSLDRDPDASIRRIFAAR